MSVIMRMKVTDRREPNDPSRIYERSSSILPNHIWNPENFQRATSPRCQFRLVAAACGVRSAARSSARDLRGLPLPHGRGSEQSFGETDLSKTDGSGSRP